MNIETDGKNSFIRTIGAVSPVGSSWTFDQNVSVRVTAKIMCKEQSNQYLRVFNLNGCIQRASGDNRIAGIPEITNVIGDDELQDATAKIEVDGNALNIRVTGVENLTLDWCIQLEVEILKDQTSILKRIIKLFS
jgi:hypothetical protein